MRVAIFGSSRPSEDPELPRPQRKGKFNEAAHSLGQELARLGHSIVVGGTASWSADFHAVKGYVAGSLSMPGHLGVIRVVRPDDRRRVYATWAKRAPRLFEFSLSSEEWWEVSHLVSVQESDAVLTIGGGRSTYLAGLAAIVAGKRLVPVGAFGGASQALARVLAEQKPGLARELDGLNGEWSPVACSSALKQMGAIGRPRLLIIHGHSGDEEELKKWLQREADVPEVIVMAHEFEAGQTLPEKFESLAAEVDGAIALATPDDLGKAARVRRLSPRARQNVWVEVGWFWGRLGRNRVMLLKRGDIEMPSDFDGLEVLAYKKSPREVGDKLSAFISQLRDGKSAD